MSGKTETITQDTEPVKYCYPDKSRVCRCGGKTEACAKCGKIVSDCEWVNNWTTCAECFHAPREGQSLYTM